MSYGDIENMMLHTIERWWAARYNTRMGIVSSYDPQNHLAKVVFQPGGHESGWLPIQTNHIGVNYGIVVGLQPGSAQSGQTTGGPTGDQGDQVFVTFQEHDHESGTISGRIHSSVDTPPTVQSGEIMLYTKFQKSGGPTPDSGSGGQGGTGQQFYMKNDGSLTHTDGNGAIIVEDGKGNITITAV
jgi:hypothetical protein